MTALHGGAGLGTVVLTLVRLGVLLLAVSVTWASVTAYRRTGEPFLRTAAIGFGVITVGVLVEGLLFQVVGVDLTTAHVVESVAIGAGLAILVYSLRQ